MEVAHELFDESKEKGMKERVPAGIIMALGFILIDLS
jgi:hypothetical protein